MHSQSLPHPAPTKPKFDRYMGIALGALLALIFGLIMVDLLGSSVTTSTENTTNARQIRGEPSL